MKKRVISKRSAAGALAAAFALFIPQCNRPVAVYGPPLDDPSFDPSDNEPVDVYGPPAEDFDPDDNRVVAVYGPPEWFEDGTAERVVNGTETSAE